MVASAGLPQGGGSSGSGNSGGTWSRWRRLFSSSSSNRRMSAVSTGERTGADLSRCLAGLTGMGSIGGNKDKSRSTVPSSSFSLPQQQHQNPSGNDILNGHPHLRNRRHLTLAINRPVFISELWQDDAFLTHFFAYLSFGERRVLAQVCSRWRDVLYQTRFWNGVLPLIRCRELRGCSSVRHRLYSSMQRRGFDSVCLVGSTDDDAVDLLNNYPPCSRHVRRLALRCSSISDKGLEGLLEHMQGVTHLELSGCNEITEAGLWACLTGRLISLSIADCINVADESVGAIAQLLPALTELSLQAYHVTDSALGYFSARQAASLSVLRLHSCWEVTNHGLVNVVNALPNLTVLSLSGCSKINDDGVELIAENLRGLKKLDLSWCPRITDSALEYIACDLTHLEDLTLDRCVHITDIGVGYVSTMLSLTSLFLRWCSQIRDFGLQHLCSMRNLRVLSLAGCSLLTSSGLSSLIQLRQLHELELTNCPGASIELFEYLHEHLPHCLIVE